MIVFRLVRSAAAMAGDAARRLTMIGAAKNDIPGQRGRSEAISSGSVPPDSGVMLTAPRAM